jgi:hypothetical protein
MAMRTDISAAATGLRMSWATLLAKISNSSERSSLNRCRATAARNANRVRITAMSTLIESSTMTKNIRRRRARASRCASTPAKLATDGLPDSPGHRGQRRCRKAGLVRARRILPADCVRPILQLQGRGSQQLDARQRSGRKVDGRVRAEASPVLGECCGQNKTRHHRGGRCDDRTTEIAR